MDFKLVLVSVFFPNRNDRSAVQWNHIVCFWNRDGGFSDISPCALGREVVDSHSVTNEPHSYSVIIDNNWKVYLNQIIYHQPCQILFKPNSGMKTLYNVRSQTKFQQFETNSVFNMKVLKCPVKGRVTSFERLRPERLTPQNLTLSDCIHLIISVRVNSVPSSSFLWFKTALIPSISPWKILKFHILWNKLRKQEVRQQKKKRTWLTR